jgi:hypothetical protein
MVASSILNPNESIPYGGEARTVLQFCDGLFQFDDTTPKVCSDAHFIGR